MPRINVLKQVKVGDRWKLVSIPKTKQGRTDWKALPEGLYFVEWYEAGKRRREAAGTTAAEAQEAARRKKLSLDARRAGLISPEEQQRRTPLHLEVKRYLALTEGLKKPNTLRKYRAVLNRFVAFFGESRTAQTLAPEDLNAFMVHLKKQHALNNNTVVHNMVIVAQFLKKCGRAGATKRIDLPDTITSLPEEYSDEELQRFFGACSEQERALFTTFLLTGFREMEVVHLQWQDINTALHTVRVTAKPHLGFHPKRWEEREVPVPVHLVELLQRHPQRPNCPLVFPNARNNREYHMLDACKRIAKAAKLNQENFTLRKFRSTYATRMLRAGFDVRTVQHWMGHKSLETTMRYLAPAKDIHDRLDQFQIPGLLPPPKTKKPRH